MFFQGVKVLVAGGTGLIGIPLVKMLVEQGAIVRVVSLDDSSRAHPEAEFIQANLMELKNCRTVCKGMEVAFNLLGVKGSPAVTTTRPASFLYPTATMELNLLEAARQMSVAKYVFTSSIAVYEPAPIFFEDDVWSSFPSKNDWFSGWSKRFGELQVEAYKTEYNWSDIAIVRPANVFGPFDNFDSRNAMVVPSLIKRAMSGETPMVVWGDGSQVRDFIHSEDVARGMLLMAEKMPDRPVNLGSGVGVTIKDLVASITNNLERSIDIHWDTTKPSGDKQRVMDISRARSYGFEPQINLENGVKDTMIWYRNNRDSTHQRYDVFDK